MMTSLIALACLGPGSALAADKWKPLTKDGLHDPAGPAIGELQQPAEALSLLPFDHAGNKVDWGRALAEGKITPRSQVMPGTRVQLLDTDVLMKRTGEMPMVLFPHRQHTEWLDCSNCHEQLFRSKAGKTEVNMTQILSGEKCGVCHGAVAFPLTECQRCHNVSREP